MKTRSLFARRRLALAATLALIGLSPAVHADSLQDIGKLIRQGQHAQAVEQADRYLASKPKDAQARFLKGIALTEMNRPADAIVVFQKLTEDYPELPEPYNNLAVIYAQQKQYDKAKSALEMAIRTHPSYATAHENLGDIYARLASQAYDKALQLDSSNSSAQNKLAMIRELMVGGTRSSAKPTPTKPAAETRPAPVESKPAETKPAEAKPVEPKPAETKPAVVATAPAAAPAPTPATTAPSPAPAAKPVEPAKPAPEPVASNPAAANDDVNNDVAKAVNHWAAAWARKDVKAYLASYAKDFKVPNGASRASWEAERRARIDKPGTIEIKLDNISVKVDGDKAVARFRQHYQAGAFKASTNKTVDLVQRDGKWLIQQERVGG